MRGRLLVRIGISLVLTVTAFMFLRGDLHYDEVDRLEHIAYDLRLRTSLPQTGDDRIVIIDIDERSLAELGHWPWSRSLLAELVDSAFENYAVLSLSFDANFPEAFPGPDAELVDALTEELAVADPEYAARLTELVTELDGDRRFAAAIANRPVVMGYVFRPSLQPDEPAALGALPAAHLPDIQSNTTVRFPTAVGYSANLEILQTPAADAGFFNQPPESLDIDGVSRRVALLQAYGDDVYASLALATIRVAMGEEEISLRFYPDAGDRPGNLDLEAVTVGSLVIPVDSRITAAVPYRGGPFTFDYVSAADVIAGRAPIEKLFGRIALVGTTAPGLLDLRATPVHNTFAGVEIHANMIAGILDGNIRHTPAWMAGYTALLLLVLSIGMSVALVQLSPLPATLTSIGSMLAVVAADQALWRAGFVAPLALPLLLGAALFIVHMTWGFFIESRMKRQLSRRFGQYVPPELVAEMERNPGAFTMVGENREMSVLFTDIRGFTTLSETLEPRELSALMNEYLTEMTRIIHEHRGTIDKYMGDAVMAFWGAPLQDPEHARRAVDAGLAMLEACNRLSWQFVSRGWPQIKIGVGISTGQMSVGNMGSKFRTAYTVLGDTVNLGSRLEGLTKNYGVLMIVSEATKDAIAGQAWRELDIVRVKGKNEPVSIFEPLGPAAELAPGKLDELELLGTALATYRAAQWDAAENRFRELDRLAPDDELYSLYLKRIDFFRRNPPGADWDGVFSHTTK